MIVEESIWISFHDGGVKPRTLRVDAVPELQINMPFNPQKNGTCLWPERTTSISNFVNSAKRSPASVMMFLSRPVPGIDTMWWWIARTLRSLGSHRELFGYPRVVLAAHVTIVQVGGRRVHRDDRYSGRLKAFRPQSLEFLPEQREALAEVLLEVNVSNVP